MSRLVEERVGRVVGKMEEETEEWFGRYLAQMMRLTLTRLVGGGAFIDK